MDEDVFNMQIRKFLKNVGVTSQREIEGAIRAAVASGKLKGSESVPIKATLKIESLGLETDITASIDLQ